MGNKEGRNAGVMMTLMNDEGTNKKHAMLFLTLRAYMKRNAVMHV
jgi:hypothetical protein